MLEEGVNFTLSARQNNVLTRFWGILYNKNQLEEDNEKVEDIHEAGYGR